ncbi:hypothetical protein SAMN05444365_1059 [Micromonospora pattaloongensis]|uniref:Uncharacterized protein n=1 Tax=Micromonospora pattaloongensis TaxID=405436 RepID=A0A1H3PT80_9ACTN|nr:hypothetical protein [Micromonospora pattaloongensis]SDZ04246.1 hypothetical protein SAMN05444365_1059 [Micromonospora pattaloongensis]
MAVECEVYDCGIDAIGRCCNGANCEVSGGAAYCTSHGYGGQCRLCLDAWPRHQEEYRAAVDAARERLTRIAAALTDAGVTPVRYPSGRTRQRKVRVGLLRLETHWVSEPDPDAMRSGWLLGTYRWSKWVTDKYGEGGWHWDRDYPTYLNTDGTLAAEGLDGGDIRKVSLTGWDQRDVDFWNGLADTAAALAKRQGVQVTD